MFGAIAESTQCYLFLVVPFHMTLFPIIKKSQCPTSSLTKSSSSIPYKSSMHHMSILLSSLEIALLEISLLKLDPFIFLLVFSTPCPISIRYVFVHQLQESTSLDVMTHLFTKVVEVCMCSLLVFFKQSTCLWTMNPLLTDLIPSILWSCGEWVWHSYHNIVPHCCTFILIMSFCVKHSAP